MKMRVEGRNTRCGWRMLSSLTGCAALAVAFAMGSQGNRAAAQSPAPAAQPAAPAAQSPSTALTPASPMDVLGIWQGTLHAGRDLRLELKITQTAAAGEYKTAFYSIDQGGQSIPVTKTIFENGTLTFSIDAIGGRYEGKMSPDGKTITGTWTQGPNPIPLVLTRTPPDAAWPIPEPVKPMEADADPGLDVATIKPSKPGAQGKGFGFQGTHFRTFNTNGNDLIAVAYGMHAKQIIGAPDWLGTDLFDIDGVPDVPGRPNIKQMGLMLQKLLADRFALKFHHEQRELSVYAIEVGGGGPKMKVTASGPNDQQGFGFRGLGDLVVINMSMKEFATWMQSSVMDKPVVDQTGLTAKYDFTLKWTPDDSQFAQFRGAVTTPPPAAGDNPNAPPSLYTAMQEQLGLKFSATKAMDDVIVIDHVEKPSAN
ncbi:MAG TPA: TIGR03435 family protein [Terracidiphilus sp.]|nr:TIGR03435 family protein [Terracidiphilus sp.]